MSILKKTNAPYLVSGALAIGTLLASGVFAVAPYAGFLAPVAALSLGLPFVIVGAVFSAVVIALSAVVINKNNTISEQKAQLANQTKEIEGKNKTIFEEKAKVKAQQQEIAKKDGEISSLRNQLAEYREARQEKFENLVAARKKEEANERAKLKDAGLLPDVIALPYKDTKVFDRANEPTKEEVNHLDYLDLATSSRKQANSLDYLNIDNVSKQFDLSNIEAAKEYLKSL